MSIELPQEVILSLAHQPAEVAGGVILGRSREGRDILGHRFGEGPLRISLIAGCHADEPVGPAMLDCLVAYLGSLPPEAPLLSSSTWRVVPHANPDGDAANASWSGLPPLAEGYNLGAYLEGAVREEPGDDMEFGFPGEPSDPVIRPENRAIATFLAETRPFHLHISFHGMAYGAGPWFLQEATWVQRARPLRQALRARVRELGYRPHEVDRGGEKGFWRIDHGFSTRPDSQAMRDFFLARGETETADRFHPSSMEYIRHLGGDPLTMVSEMPLFLYDENASAETTSSHGDPPLPTGPEPARRFQQWAQLLLRHQGREALGRETTRLGLRPMPVGDQMRLQLALLEEGLRTVARHAAD